MVIETEAELLHIMKRKQRHLSEDVLDERPRLHNVGMVFGDLIARRSSQLVLRGGVDPMNARHDLRLFTNLHIDGEEPLILRGSSHAPEQVKAFNKSQGRNGLIVVENFYDNVLSPELTKYLGKIVNGPESAMICAVEDTNEGEGLDDIDTTSHIANLVTRYTVEPPKNVVRADTDSGAWCPN